jgi:glycosyltransferase involved in cell wall biosynthesis
LNRRGSDSSGLHEGKGPLVSVVIPCYNGEAFIREALESVLAQDYENIEIVVVDDGSTDGSPGVVAEYVGEHPVTLLTNEENRGIGYARNRGISAARGSYIAFLDQDDIWLPDKVSRQLEVFSGAGEGLGLVFSNVYHMKGERVFEHDWPRRRIPKDFNALPREEVFEALFLHNFIPMITVMVPRACLQRVGGFDERLRGGADDYDLCLRIAAEYRLCYLDRKLAVHRLHERNYSDDLLFIRDELVIMEKMCRRYPRLSSLRDRKMGIIYARLGDSLMLEGKKDLARRYYRLACETGEPHWKWRVKGAVARLDSLCRVDTYGMLRRIMDACKRYPR